MGRPKKLQTKPSKKSASPLSKFVVEQPVMRQIYARVPAEKADRIVQILERENLSIYEGISIAISMLISYYEKKKL
jgi:hypothetical protein